MNESITTSCYYPRERSAMGQPSLQGSSMSAYPMMMIPGMSGNLSLETSLKAFPPKMQSRIPNETSVKPFKNAMTIAAYHPKANRAAANARRPVRLPYTAMKAEQNDPRAPTDHIIPVVSANVRWYEAGPENPAVKAVNVRPAEDLTRQLECIANRKYLPDQTERNPVLW